MSQLAVSPKLRSNYDAYYDGESEWRTLGAIDKVSNIVELCRAVPHHALLEIGSGEGAVLKRLSEVGFGDDLCSLEISRSATEAILNRNLPRLRECRLFDGYEIPYSDRKFDLAVLSHVLEHTEYPRKLLYEASRVARYVFVEVPLEDTLRLKPDYTFDAVGHINYYSWKTMRRLIQTCDLQIISERITNPSPAVHRYCHGAKGVLTHAVKEVLLRTSPRLASKLFTYHYALVCTSASGAGEHRCPGE